VSLLQLSNPLFEAERQSQDPIEQFPRINPFLDNRTDYQVCYLHFESPNSLILVLKGKTEIYDIKWFDMPFLRSFHQSVQQPFAIEQTWANSLVFMAIN